MALLDPHSYADDTQPRTRAFEWKARVDFESHTLEAEVTRRFASPASGGPLDLDTRALTIHAVTGPNGEALPFKLHAPDEVKGSRLEVTVSKGAEYIHVRYRTSKEASALQWVTKEQTLGKAQPYLFSQCQAIHARSVVPCQDTPSIRQTFTAELDVPSNLRAVMGAATKGREMKADRAIDRFEMPQPIPPYLLAFAVGDLAKKDLSPRTCVWAEPAQLEAAAWELEGVEAQLRAAESLFGPYDWERFDLLVMPPSFPYGGMENPRLTFLTPSLLAGDRSLVNVVAHELAHSWTGNLVTNATAEHFWLNEGFTVFAERRILEALEGTEMAALHAAVGYEKLKEAFTIMAGTPELTQLRTHLDGIDPDMAFSVVPYEKGYLFLKTLEAAAGRAAFDALLTTWLEGHRFGAATTDDFLALVEKKLPGVLAKIDAKAWIDGPLLPAGSWMAESARLAAVKSTIGRVPTKEETHAWTAIEWALYLEMSPRPSAVALCKELDETYALTKKKNAEVLVCWLILAARSGYEPVLPRVREVLGQTGRMKYLKPLYRALAARPETKDLAKELFAQYRATYHPIAQETVAALLAKA